MFKVERRYAGGWEDAEWTEDGKPQRFKTKKGAQAEIAEHCKETRRAVRRGEMYLPDVESEFRVVKE